MLLLHLIAIKSLRSKPLQRVGFKQQGPPIRSEVKGVGAQHIRLAAAISTSRVFMSRTLPHTTRTRSVWPECLRRLAEHQPRIGLLQEQVGVYTGGLAVWPQNQDAEHVSLCEFNQTRCRRLKFLLSAAD